MIRVFMLVGMLSALAGCAYYPNDQSKAIHEAHFSHIKHCTLLGQVYGSSDFAYLAMGLEMAKDRAKAQAAEIGATHVTWTEVNSVGLPYVVGKAYLCKN